MKPLLYLSLIVLFGCGEKQEETSSNGTTQKQTTEEQASVNADSSSNAKAPDNFRILFSTTKGDFIVEVDRSWSPNGADRLYDLVQQDFFTDIAFFRAIEGFMTQFGIHGDPQISQQWRNKNIKDDPVTQSNTIGMLTYAKTNLPNSRSTQFFINTNNNVNLDALGFSPVGKVLEDVGGGMSVVKELYTGYGEGPPRGKGPNQMLIQTKGNVYLKAEFPNLDYIKSAQICNNPECK